MASCSGTTQPGPDQRLIKYEVTGKVFDTVTIYHYDNDNHFTYVNSVTLPWTKELRYSGDIVQVGIGVDVSNAQKNDHIRVTIYSGGREVKTDSVKAPSAGELLMPLVTYSFQ